MNFQKFNRHEIFNAEMMKYHSTTVRQVEDFLINTDQDMFNDLTNSSYGIWDGYLYTDILQSAKKYRLTQELVARVKITINFIMEKTHLHETI
jgi:hypothetical protein